MLASVHQIDKKSSVWWENLNITVKITGRQKGLNWVAQISFLTLESLS